LTFPNIVCYIKYLNIKEVIMPYNNPEQPKAFRIQLSIKRHTELKMLAAKLGTTMDKLVNKLIQDKLNMEEK
jgi:hypothetical protein